MIKAILFDMDGTLLPMDINEFTMGYFKLLYKKMVGFGVPQDVFVKAVLGGTKAMQANDGSALNKDVFWAFFTKVTGATAVDEMIAVSDDFYGNEFNEAINLTQPNPLAAAAVAAAHKAAGIVALSTNPLFPMPGQRTRMSWLGLSEEDFALVTSYETDCYCKPNPAYFTTVCERLGVDPADCLVIGNDEYEDMFCAAQAGIGACYLVTDWMIASPEHPWDGPRGTFAEMVEMLEGMAADAE